MSRSLNKIMLIGNLGQDPEIRTTANGTRVANFSLATSRRWTGLFLSTAFATSATGFGFPFNGVLPSHIVGAISLVLLAIAGVALYARRLDGRWRRGYAVSAMLAFYLLVFVAIAQAFLKVPALRALAPTQAEPPFAVVQGTVLLVFVALTWLAARRFGSAPPFRLA